MRLWALIGIVVAPTQYAADLSYAPSTQMAYLPCFYLPNRIKFAFWTRKRSFIHSTPTVNIVTPTLVSLVWFLLHNIDRRLLMTLNHNSSWSKLPRWATLTPID